jgi:hypothetical protein
VSGIDPLSGHSIVQRLRQRDNELSDFCWAQQEIEELGAGNRYTDDFVFAGQA